MAKAIKKADPNSEVLEPVELTMEEKIVKFIDEAPSSPVRLNDFLKSLYPLPSIGEPPVWKQQLVSRNLRHVLFKMQNDGLISIEHNTHLELGNFHYPVEGGATQYRNLSDVEIFAKK